MVWTADRGRRGPASLEDQIVLHHAADKMPFLHGSHEAKHKAVLILPQSQTGRCHWRGPPEIG